MNRDDLNNLREEHRPAPGSCEDIDMHERGYGERLTCQQAYPEAPSAWCPPCVVQRCEQVPSEEDIVRCGHSNDPHDQVCGECGAQLWSREDYEREAS